MHGSYDHVERAGFWYLLYVCYHHFSIAYRWPPVIHQDATISCYEMFLQVPATTQSNYRLHSEVGVFIKLSKIFDTSSTDPSKEISDMDFRAISVYNVDLDLWRLKWETQLGTNPSASGLYPMADPQAAPNMFVSEYPAKGVNSIITSRNSS